MLTRGILTASGLGHRKPVLRQLAEVFFLEASGMTRKSKRQSYDVAIVEGALSPPHPLSVSCAWAGLGVPSYGAP